MKLSKLIAVLSLVTAGSFAVPSMAAHHGGPMGPMKFLLSDRGAEKLELSEGQRSQIRAIFDAHKQEMEGVRAAHHGERAALKAQVQSTDFDEAKVRALLVQQQGQGIEAKLAKARVHHQIWNLLSEQQQQKLEQLKERRHAKKQGKGSYHH